MKQTRLLMGMPISIEVVSSQASEALFDRVYDYLTYVDQTFSPYKPTSLVSQLNAGQYPETTWSSDFQEVVHLCQQTQAETNGYFNPWHQGVFDPSGVVKGWAIQNAAERLKREGFRNFYVEAGGDIQLLGRNNQGKPWQVGIRNPFGEGICRILTLESGGVATSGTYRRGQHIYNPHQAGPLTEIASLTVVGETVLDADRFATAAFAMGRSGIELIAQLGLEAYQISTNHLATFTTGLSRYLNA